MKSILTLVGLLVAASSAPLLAQGLPKPQDVAYPGTLHIEVDATDTSHHILAVRETIPVKPGPQVLLFPEWLPGTHSKSYVAISRLAGLRLSAGGHPLEWHRDLVEMAAFHIDVPAGVTQIEAEFQYLTPLEGHFGAQRVVMSPSIVSLSWNEAMLYPAGYYTSRILADASVTLPLNWEFATALETASRSGNTAHFKTTTLSELVDSPLLAGKYFKRIDLDPGAAVHVWLDLAADRPENLEIKPEQLAVHRNLVQQAQKLFGSHHYDHYDFLLSLSDAIGGVGLEHHQSSEDSDDPEYFTAWDDKWTDRDLLPHEYAHSWNGKFRRPLDLTTTNFNVPMEDDLLWLYEGQTQYWGLVLAARSGLFSAEQWRDLVALDAADLSYRAGRTWRNLQDTTGQDIMYSASRPEWASWQRSEDYYTEGALIWLDADTKIREMSGGARSLDDFAKAFFGINDGSHAVVTYRFADIVAALNAVQPYDWAEFLRSRLDSHGPGAPLDGLARGGWELVYSDEPSAATRQMEQQPHSEGIDFNYSIGVMVEKDGKLRAVRWDSPAFAAGLAPGDVIEAVNRLAFDPDILRDAIVASHRGTAPIELIVRDHNNFRIVNLDYHDGLRYPRLVRKTGTPDRLSLIVAPRA